MKHIYLDTNQLYYLRRCAEEGGGSDFGDCRWAHQYYSGNPGLVKDIRALCYIIALSDQWELRISSSDASFAELCRSASERARATREAWKLFAEGIDEGQLKREARLPRGPADEHPRFSFVEDRDDRAILWHVVQEGADVLLTSDEDILRHRERLLAMGVRVMRPSEWLDVFLSLARGSEDALRLA